MNFETIDLVIMDDDRKRAQKGLSSLTKATTEANVTPPPHALSTHQLHTVVTTVATLPSKLRPPRISSAGDRGRAQLPPMASLADGDSQVRGVGAAAEQAAPVVGHVGRSLAPLEKPSTRARAAGNRAAQQPLAEPQLPTAARRRAMQIVVPPLSPPRSLTSPLKRTRADRGSPPTDEDGEARPGLLPIALRAVGRPAGKALAAGRRLAAARAAFPDDVLDAHAAGVIPVSTLKLAPSSHAPVSAASVRVRASSASARRPAQQRLPVAAERARAEVVRTSAPRPQLAAAASAPAPRPRGVSGLSASRPPELLVPDGHAAADADARDGESVSWRSFSPPLVPISARQHSGADARWSARSHGSGSPVQSAADLKAPPALDATRPSAISLRYDPTLCCYFCPISHKYYELR